MKKLIITMLTVFSALSLSGQAVTGVIVDESGLELIGAVVMVRGTSAGTVTDADGRFSIAASKGDVLEVSLLGYAGASQEVGTASDYRIVLREDVSSLEELVFTGYAVQRKADLTGAVSVVDMGELSKQRENNPMKAMQGRIPGMNITSDGSPSGSATVRIRGIGTLNNNDPLYIIDGVPTKGGMHELNGSDIETIQVLKDASSASIYGSRAANGVIVITTRKGKEGTLNINFEASVGMSMYTTKMDVLNTAEYGRAMWQAYINEGQNPNTNALGYRYDWGYDASGYPILNKITMDRYLDSEGLVPAADTDWFSETMRNGVVQQYNLSVSSGGPKTSSFFSLGYYKNLGIIKTTDFDRISARANNEFKLFDGILLIGEHFSLNRTTEVQAPGGFLENVLQENPSLPVYDVNGNFAGPVGGYPDRENPLARLTRNADNRYTYWRTFGDVYLNLNPLKGLNIRATFGLDYSQKSQRILTYPVTEGNVANSLNASELKQEHWLKWMGNLVATWAFEFGKHRGDVMVGMELNRERNQNASAYKEEYLVLTPDYMWPSAGVGNAQASGSSDGYSLVSFFGKINYNFDERYLLSLTLRHDGSSRFGRSHRFATFPSVSAGWRIGQEAFLKDVDWIDDIKLRASWGQTGNQEISNVARYTLFVSHYGVSESGGGSYGTSYDISGSNGGSILPSGFKRDQLGNDDIKWETTTQTNLGLDFSFFHEKLYGSLEGFYKKTSDILVLMAGIGVMGEGSSKWINAGTMQNHGVEFSLGYRNRFESGFGFDINANISSYRNKILELPATVAANGTFGGNGVQSVIGHAFGSQVGYIADGIFKSQQEVDNHAYQEGAAPGRIRYRDLNGDGVVSEADQTWIFDPTPAFSYGFNISLEYKDFDLTMFWQGVQGVQVISDLKKETDLWSGLNIGFLNKGRRLLDAWTPQNPDADIPALSRSDTNNEKRVSTYFIEDGSFLKLRSLQLGYNLPSSIAEKVKMKKLRVYFSAQNLLTISSRNFTGVDPENPNFGYPIPLTLTLGLNVGF
ncbi:MAG: TonB-dependent receptor [Bacteroidales bacterium]|nr:TonB-dependent receptor [Bacteroidales bacterium]